MKKIKQLFFFSALTLLSVSIAFGQTETQNLPIDSSTNRITYSEVVSVDSLANKQKLFSRAREWFAKAYNSSTNVIQMEDKESGKIVGKALMAVYHKGMFGSSDYPSGNIHYTISIYIKDGRYKYEITDFYHTGEYVGSGVTIADYGVCENMINTTGLNKKRFNYYLDQIDSNSKNLIADLKVAMKTNATDTNESEW